MEENYQQSFNCDPAFIMALKDSLNAVSGKWKLAIVCVLLTGKKRFSEIQRIVPTITPRMISKELKELEINGIISRNVINSIPVVIEYALTPSGRKLRDVIIVMVEWGILHREISLSSEKYNDDYIAVL